MVLVLDVLDGPPNLAAAFAPRVPQAWVASAETPATSLLTDDATASPSVEEAVRGALAKDRFDRNEHTRRIGGVVFVTGAVLAPITGIAYSWSLGASGGREAVWPALLGVSLGTLDVGALLVVSGGLRAAHQTGTARGRLGRRRIRDRWDRRPGDRPGGQFQRRGRLARRAGCVDPGGAVPDRRRRVR